jgi:hypothetical protein
LSPTYPPLRERCGRGQSSPIAIDILSMSAAAACRISNPGTKESILLSSAAIESHMSEHQWTTNKSIAKQHRAPRAITHVGFSTWPDLARDAQRIRDVRAPPDGYLSACTDEDDGRVLRPESMN